MSAQKPSKPIGKTTATYNIPNTVDEFYFWVDEGETIEPYDFVTAKSGEFSCLGVVNEISVYTDAQSHLSNRLGADIEDTVSLSRLGATVARSTVFYGFLTDKDGNTNERRVPIPSNAEVYRSTPDEIMLGLTLNQQANADIPAGVIRGSSGLMVPVKLDHRYLLGPESAHANISGISGLATKTSYMMFLLYSVAKVLPDQYINIVFNVKQADLMNIDSPPDSQRDVDKKLYNAIFGEDAQPFKNVNFFQPAGIAGNPFSFSNGKGSLYSFQLSDVYQDMDLLFGDVDDTWHTVEAFSRRFAQDWDKANNQWVLNVRKSGSQQSARTWVDLMNILDQNEEDVAKTYGLRSDTVSRIRRELSRLTSSSLFPSTRAKQVFIREIIRNANAGQTLVIDIAKLRKSEQTFVVGEVFRELENIILQENEMQHRKAIVVVDELNSLAPASYSNPLKEQIIEVARKGRSAGFIIFGAEQFASEVDDQIVGNSSLRAFGRTSSVESSSGAYRGLTEADKLTIMRLGKGDMLISFPTFRSNIKITFPIPPYKMPA